jgi:hypothetical protein
VLAILAVATARPTLITGLAASTAALVMVAITDAIQERVHAPEGCK